MKNGVCESKLRRIYEPHKEKNSILDTCEFFQPEVLEIKKRCIKKLRQCKFKKKKKRMVGFKLELKEAEKKIILTEAWN